MSSHISWNAVVIQECHSYIHLFMASRILKVLSRAPGFASTMQLALPDIICLLDMLPRAHGLVQHQRRSNRFEMARAACGMIRMACGQWAATEPIGYLWCVLTLWKMYGHVTGERLLGYVTYKINATYEGYLA